MMPLAKFSQTISALGLGVEKPPNCSGQTGINSYLSLSFIRVSFKLFFPLYLQSTPIKHALTKKVSIASFFLSLFLTFNMAQHLLVYLFTFAFWTFNIR